MNVPDDVHTCPVCGAWWFVERASASGVGTQAPGGDSDLWFVPEHSGWCSDPRCAISNEQRDEYRVLRRQMGWDPTDEPVSPTTL